LLWELLRDRQLCSAKFRRQHQFGEYICDFFCAEAKLAVECDGSSHDSPERKKHDAKRDAYLKALGLTVLRFSNSQVMTATDSVLDEIATHLPAPSGEPVGLVSAAIPGDLLTHDQRQRVYRNLHGYDITDLMVKLSKVNLFLHGFPDPAIHIYDTLSNDARWHEKADLILANPPFMTPKGGVTPHTKFRIAAKKAEVLFTDYIAEHLTPDGRGGVIVPNGIVATTQNAYVKLRRFLVEDALVAVVSLPAGVFKPYSGVKTSILFLDKKLARQRKEILFLKITADGFDLGDKRTPSEANDLPEAERVVKLWLAGKLKEGTESSVAWKAVEKKTLLENRSVNLQAEAFLGNGAAVAESDVVRLADVVEINPGKADARALPPETEASFVPMEDLPTDRPDFIATRTRPVGEVITGYTCFRDRDVLFAKITPCFENGKAGIAAGLKNGIGFGSTEFYVLRASAKILPEFVYQIVKRKAFRDEGAENMAGTAGQQRVRRDFIENYEIPLPPLEEQRRIVAEIAGYQQEIARLKNEIAENRVRIQQTIDAVWTGETPSANGAMLYQPGATPQEMERQEKHPSKKGKG
jgi:type I restriction enzyme M protein